LDPSDERPPQPDARHFRGTLGGRLVAGYVVALVVVLAIIAVPLDRRLESALLDDLTSSLTTTARAARRALPPQDSTLQAAVVPLGRELRVRITVIRPDGTVLADSEHDPATMDNHAGRPEVRAALAGAVGVATRTSDTVGRPFRYVALPPEAGRVVRVALAQDVVASRLGRTRALIATGAGLALALGVLAAWGISRRLTRPLSKMTAAAAAIADGSLERRVPEEGATELVQLASTMNRMANDLGARIEAAGEERHTRDVVLAAMDEGVILVGPNGEVQYANPSAQRLAAGIGSEGARSSPESGRPYMPQMLRSLIAEARSAGSVREREIEIGRPARTVLASSFPVGSEGLSLLVLRDVTEARRVDAIRRDFVAAASHELKTPVASIQAAAETLAHALTEDPVAAKRFVDHLQRDSERLSMIVRDLLDLSRLESQGAALEDVRLDLVAGEELDRFRERARDASLEIALASVPATVRGSSEDLALLIGNLLDNAIRYTRPGGRINVEVAPVDGAVRLAVSDTGIGIPGRDLPRIFERFYRVDRARSRDTGGTGLGLSIVRHVAERHGGTVEARSELGRGSTFVVTLPPPADS
jgi:two-component system, OmpR family, phosphate regulon sensor histidine kinase PhoR